jgi:Skp family chaperone for outer membrane proteins
VLIVRFSHLMATLVAGSSLAGAVFVVAQGPGTGSAPMATMPGTRVAIVDVKYIVDNLDGFKSAMDRIKQENDSFVAQVQDQETMLRKKLEELKGIAPGSDPFKQLEEQISLQRTKVQLEIKRRQSQRVEDEAKVSHRAYQDGERTIAIVAQRYGIDLVLQHSAVEIDPGKPDTVIRGLNRLVLYQSRLDLTPAVLAQLKAASPAPPGGGGVTTPNRGGGAAPRIASPPGAPNTNPGVQRK